MSSRKTLLPVVRKGRRGSHRAWKLIDRQESEALVMWVPERPGINVEMAWHKVSGVTRLFRWFYLTRGRSITANDATPAVLEL
jgi:hypothetical protein